MSDNELYKPPQSEIVVQTDNGSGELRSPRSVPAGNGWLWLRDAFRIFARDWPTWLAIGVVFIVINMVLGILPLGTIATSLLYPVFAAGIVIAARDGDGGAGARFTQLFAGFQRQTGPLVGLGALSMAITFVLFLIIGVVVMLILGGASLLQAVGDPRLFVSAAGPGIAIAVLVGLALYVPVIMLFWFASTLVVFHGKPVFEAMGSSFEACLANIVPFLVYGLVALIFMFLAAIPAGLGFLVMLPVLFITLYTGYKDIFLHVNPD